MGNLLQVIENIAGYVNPISIMLFVLSFVIGVSFAMVGIKGAARRSEMGPSAGPWTAPMWTFIIGVMFVALPAMVLSISTSIFGAEGTGFESDPQEIFSYASVTVGLFEVGSPGRAVITGIVRVVQLVGLIAVMRGLFLLNQSAQGGSGPKTFGPGFTFVVAGVCAVNFPIFVGVMESILLAP